MFNFFEVHVSLDLELGDLVVLKLHIILVSKLMHCPHHSMFIKNMLIPLFNGIFLELKKKLKDYYIRAGK